MTNLEREIKRLTNELAEVENRIKYSTEYAKQRGYVEEYNTKRDLIQEKLQLLEEAQRLVDAAEAIAVY